MSTDFRVLSDEELTGVVAGLNYDRFLYENLGMCACGRRHD